MASSTQLNTKRPRLSLQTKPAAASRPPTKAVSINPSDPATFNTLSNAYAAVVGRSAAQRDPMSAVSSVASPAADYKSLHLRVVTPHVAAFPETPISATSPMANLSLSLPSTLTSTPPMSAGSLADNLKKPFSFSAADVACSPSIARLIGSSAVEPPRPLSRINTTGVTAVRPPYSPSVATHSILRNSPLPPRTVIHESVSVRRSWGFKERVTRRVVYTVPLTQDIVNHKYTRSHIDLLNEDLSPSSPQTDAASRDCEMSDCSTPAPPKEEAKVRKPLPTSRPPSSPAPASPRGVQKRKTREKRRRWVWTIGQNAEEGEELSGAVLAAKRADAMQTQVVESASAVVQVITPDTPTDKDGKGAAVVVDVAMSDACPPSVLPHSSGLPSPPDAKEMIVDLTGEDEDKEVGDASAVVLHHPQPSSWRAQLESQPAATTS